MTRAPSTRLWDPICKDNVTETITHMLKAHYLEPLLQGYDWSKWELAKPQGAWPSTTATWAAWVTRMEPHFVDEWKTLSIFYAIKLSTFEITMDRELLMIALSFWCSAISTMIFHLGHIGPPVLDITAILGTSPSGFPIDTALSRYKFDLHLKVVFDERAVEVFSKKNQRPSKEDV